MKILDKVIVGEEIGHLVENVVMIEDIGRGRGN